MPHPLEKFTHCPCCGSELFRINDEKSRRCHECGFEYYLNPSAAYVALIYNNQGQLLVVRRQCEPARGTLDLPGGFADIGETAEQGVAREVFEETGLEVIHTEYLFSLPNTYLYSDFPIPTLDLFFRCQVRDTSTLHAHDDAAECLWLHPHDINPTLFGLTSIRKGVERIIENEKKYKGERINFGF